MIIIPTITLSERNLNIIKKLLLKEFQPGVPGENPDILFIDDLQEIELPKWAKYGLAGLGTAAALGLGGYAAYNYFNPDEINTSVDAPKVDIPVDTPDVDNLDLNDNNDITNEVPDISLGITSQEEEIANEYKYWLDIKYDASKKMQFYLDQMDKVFSYEKIAGVRKDDIYNLFEDRFKDASSIAQNARHILKDLDKKGYNEIYQKVINSH